MNKHKHLRASPSPNSKGYGPQGLRIFPGGVSKMASEITKVPGKSFGFDSRAEELSQKRRGSVCVCVCARAMSCITHGNVEYGYDTLPEQPTPTRRCFYRRTCDLSYVTIPACLETSKPLDYIVGLFDAGRPEEKNDPVQPGNTYRQKGKNCFGGESGEDYSTVYTRQTHRKEFSPSRYFTSYKSL